MREVGGHPQQEPVEDGLEQTHRDQVHLVLVQFDYLETKSDELLELLRSRHFLDDLNSRKGGLLAEQLIRCALRIPFLLFQDQEDQNGHEEVHRSANDHHVLPTDLDVFQDDSPQEKTKDVADIAIGRPNPQDSALGLDVEMLIDQIQQHWPTRELAEPEDDKREPRRPVLHKEGRIFDDALTIFEEHAHDRNDRISNGSQRPEDEINGGLARVALNQKSKEETQAQGDVDQAVEQPEENAIQLEGLLEVGFD